MEDPIRKRLAVTGRGRGGEKENSQKTPGRKETLTVMAHWGKPGPTGPCPQPWHLSSPQGL